MLPLAFLLPLVCLLSLGPALPAFPAAAELQQARIFAEPLVPAGEPAARETAALGLAIAAYQAAGATEAVTPLLGFLEAHPGSGWSPALWANLGVIYRDTGYFSRALAAWERAWPRLKDADAGPLRSLGDMVVGELLELHGRIGNRERMRRLLAELEGRPVLGSAAEKVSRCRRGLWIMDHEPGQAYRCGPLALAAILSARGRAVPEARLDRARSTHAGTSLEQNRRWAGDLRLGLQAARRQPGAAMPTPALVHWKAGHYAALVGQRDGRYLVEDPTFGAEVWISRAALDAEASGYALVPAGPLAAGWRPVAPAEARAVWGKGTTSIDPDYDTPDPDPDCRRAGMPGYRFYRAYLALGLADNPVGYTPPRGHPVAFRLSYNQRNRNQPQTFTCSNLGPGWSFDWLSWVQDDPGHPGQTTALFDGIGERRAYTRFDPATQSFAIQYRTFDQLVRTGAASYELRQADGSREVYAQPDRKAGYPRRLFLSQRLDPAGNALTFSYDERMRLTTVTDALGQTTRLSYELGSDPLKLTRVSDPFGRTAALAYNAAGQLAAITDAVGLTSSFSYGPTPGSPAAPAGFIHAMTTPYGVTTFQTGEAGGARWLEVTDPTGQRERLEFRHDAPGVAMREPRAPAGFVNDHLGRRNTYHWDKHAMARCPGDYSKARVTHFLHAASGSLVLSSLVESTKEPLESRVWRSYGQGSTIVEGPGSRPVVEARMLDDGSEQRTTWQYNRWGRITQHVDPLGRRTEYSYSADGLDLLAVRNTTGGRDELLASYSYNPQHRPLTATDAAGRTTRFSYNPWGQIQSITDPEARATTFDYDAQGRLRQLEGPAPGARTRFDHDPAGRLEAVTGADAGTTCFQYDNLDRRTRVSYPDGTAETSVYDRLEVGRTQDRQGRWTRMAHNGNRQLVEVQDPLGRTTRLDWCGCGTLEGLTDPMGRTTTWIRDLQGRVAAKVHPDRSETRYGYDGAGRLAERTDAKGQVTRYAYGRDDRLSQVSYDHAQQPTPGTQFSYDPAYGRLISAVDGRGSTSFGYHPIGQGLGAGRLATVTGPLARSAISYGYDALGRVTRRDIDGSAETRTFDAHGLARVDSALGPFSYGCDPITGRLQDIAYPNGQHTAFTHLDPAGGGWLQGIQSRKADGGVLASFGYSHDPGGQIKAWSQAAGGSAPQVFSFSYDAAGQLLGATLADPATGRVLKTFAYGYDGAGNRTTEQINDAITSASHNALNQLTGQAFSAAPALT